MANGDSSGAVGILGVVIGAVIVIALGFFLINGGMFRGGGGPASTVNVDVKPPSLPSPAK